MGCRLATIGHFPSQHNCAKTRRANRHEEHQRRSETHRTRIHDSDATA